MKNLILKIFCLTFFLGFLSCDEEAFLDGTELSNNQLDDEFTSNMAVDDVLRGGYFNLGSPGNTGSTITSMSYNDIVADLMDLKPYSTLSLPGNNSFMTPTYERQTEINDNRLITQNAESAYMVIGSANTILDFYRDNEVPDDNPQWASRIQGEAFFLRALGHYQLVTTFAPPFSSDSSAPAIVLRRQSPLDAADLPGLSTVEETYNFIISDLKRAIELLPETYVADRDPEWSQDAVKRDGARFLLARVYFRMGSSFWESGMDGDGGALEQINAIITGNRHSVDEYGSLRDIYNRSGLGNIASETIWQVAYYFRNGWRNPRFQNWYGNLNTNERGLPLSKAILNKIGWDDEAFALQDQRYADLFIRFEKDGSGINGADPIFATDYIDDYNVWCIKYGINAGAREISYVVFRLPEMYLTRAVIRLENGDMEGAAQDINITRERAGLPPLTTATFNDVEEEWIKELSFEHSRLTFLQATRQSVPGGDRTSIGDVPYDDPSLVRVLPLKQITRNPNLN